jgi:hypothetical protein
VATLHRGRLTAGEHVLRWDGRGAGAGRVPNGLHFCRVTGAGTSVARRVAFIAIRSSARDRPSLRAAAGVPACRAATTLE